MARQQADTSKLAYEVICREGAKETHYKRILDSLTEMGNGTSYEIAAHAKMKDGQVWKRQNELIKSELIADTGLRRNSPDGNPSIVYCLFSDKDKYSSIPKPERQEKTTASDHANWLIANTGKRLVQPELF